MYRELRKYSAQCTQLLYIKNDRNVSEGTQALTIQIPRQVNQGIAWSEFSIQDYRWR